MKEVKPEQITWTSVGSNLGLVVGYLKNKINYHWIKAYIEPQIETLEEYHVRKIKWD